MYKFQTRQPKIQREDSSSKYSDLHKINSYTPGHWKNYVPTEVSHSTEKRSNKTPSYYNNRGQQANYDGNIEDDSRIRSILMSRKEQQKKRQESAMRKVRQLQEKVLPLVKNNREEDEQVWIGWQSRIQQKVLRLQGQVDNMKKQMQLQLQKRIVQLQNRWQNKFSQYLRNIKHEPYPPYMQN